MPKWEVKEVEIYEGENGYDGGRESGFAELKRIEVSSPPLSERHGGVDEVALCFSDEQAKRGNPSINILCATAIIFDFGMQACYITPYFETMAPCSFNHQLILTSEQSFCKACALSRGLITP